ncbi:MAG: hypothetical protein JWM57_896 [Phycisphaerales bacterium]|nr:hypothetical protein [Phycisphaerales bacterium]
MHRRPVIALVLLTSLLGGCAARPPFEPNPSIVTTLYFGLGKADGTTVTDAEWTSFVEGDIARLFPAGFTLLDGRGAWRSEGKTSYEPSHLVIIARACGPKVDAAIDELRTTYCERFGQESVLRVDQDARLITFN